MTLPATQFIDVSHVIEHNMVTYRGLPGPLICDYLSRADSRQFYAPGTEFHIGRIDMVANTGTYVDAPFHRYADGADIADLPLHLLANLPGVVVTVDYRQQRAIGTADFMGVEVHGKAVLVNTNWDEHWGQPAYFAHHPYLIRDAAEYLADAGAVLVGIDSHNIDDTAGNSRPVHSTLLRAGIPIAEHLCNLRALPSAGFRFFAVPAKVRALGTFPVRAFGLITPEHTPTNSPPGR